MPRISLKDKRDRQYASIRGAINCAMAENFIKSDTELCRRLKFDPRTYSKHKNDMDVMKLGELMRIAEYLGLEIIVKGGKNETR